MKTKKKDQFANHFIEADAKFCGDKFFWVSVVFRSDREISRLIKALSKLKRTRRRKNVHLHLTDKNFSIRSGLECVEIIFSGPDYEKKNRKTYVREATRFLWTARSRYIKSGLIEQRSTGIHKRPKLRV